MNSADINVPTDLLWLEKLGRDYKQPVHAVYFALCTCTGNLLQKSTDSVTILEIVDHYFVDRRITDQAIRDALLLTA